MLQFECPQCHAKMRAEEEHAGKTAVCPGCGASVTIPVVTSAITAEPGVSAPAGAITTPEKTRPAKKASAPADDDDVDRPRRRDRSDAGAAVAVGMSVGMVVLIAVVGGACALMVCGGILDRKSVV